MSGEEKYTDVVVTIKDGIGTIKFNRPKQLNSFGGSLVEDTIAALRELNDHPDTTFTVITGEGRFFASGADVTSIANTPDSFKNDGQAKVFWAQRMAVGMELVRSMIDHKKVLVLALNGPGVGAGAAWFQGSSDLFYAAEGSWLQVTFSQMGLVPENGSAQNWADHMGVHRANEWLMLGGKASVEELKEIGMVNKIFPKEGFHEAVHQHLKDILKERSGRSMIITKELQNKRTRDARMLSLFEAWNALAERFVEGEPMLRMKAKMQELADKRKNRQSKM
ncbi:Enoyl-CoA delta isomerase 2 [Fulvia fulva]|uniref:Enoyl-CoA delta isomerase 2 n=1 Tax=Passalora fulva TaxID=5499 RepID=A0A9Q8PLV5_PASFU|nr:Enoyl-CoA delta isomerase 2 [Fulvia fulva]KAK4610605.1 Enoyl-CoA delta isomerase 2 [Fulvia fulva]KAK4610954.1 Enoyl-CoA delta isomerase 2 [Fulvia fulva]UJO24826.1 Enoyl-CoA delta isomerase 2 [Fulvia fulva]WPV21700.1 Enoyl-CoA delta isomerase 2 [Fulvia fulva]WPV36637.1 Enoyl-CoA delta isomerase 2 [Fulvia fulva]